MQKYFEIGQIVTTNGIKGFVKVNPFTDNIKRYDDLKSIYIEYKSELLEFKIEEVRYYKNQVILKLEGIDSIEEANKYRNCYLKIKREDAVILPENTYFIADLIGIQVFDESNNFLGNIVDIFSTGSNDVYVVKNEIGKEILLPAISEVIKQIDIKNSKMVVNLIEGLNDEI